MGAGERDQICLLIHACFASHAEKRTGIWFDAERLATFAVYVYVISGKNKNMNPLRIVTGKPYLAMCVRRVLMPPVKNAVCLTEGSSLRFVVSKIENNEENRYTYRQILHQWPSRDFPVVRWVYFLSRLKMRRTSAVRSSRGLEAAACVGDERRTKVKGMENAPDYRHLP